MRIAYIGLRGVPANYSGIERAVEEIGSRLVQNGHEVTVYCMNSAYIDRVQVYKGMNLRYVSTIPSKNLEMLIYSLISSMTSCFQNYDIVHFHALGPAVMSFLPKFLGRKTVVTIHGLDWKREKWGGAAKVYLKLGEKAACLFPHTTIVVSESLRNYFKTRYGRNTEYIPNGVALQTPHPLKDTRRFGIEEARYILFVARLTPEKNVHQLIEAFQEIPTDFKLVIVGSAGHLDDYQLILQRLADNDSRVILTGAQHGETLAELFSNAYLFVLPSALEGLPIALLEAMSFGIPALVSDIPENLEVIDNGGERCGFTFKVGSVESLRNTLASVLEQGDDVKKIGSKGQSLVASKYNWDIVAEQTERVYMDLLQ
ncbi:MAG: glycosyltransferase family 4 protein [Methylococcales bacterium]